MTFPNPCQIFFDGNLENREKVKILQNEEGCVEWESMKASKYSPCVVKGDETLLRFIFSPHWDRATGKPTPIAVEDVANKGLSVNRLKYAELQATHRFAQDASVAERQAAAMGRPRKLEALMWLRVAKIREVRLDEQRALGVYDTALVDNRAHADVCQLRSGQRDGRTTKEAKQAGRSVREALFALLER